MTTPWRGYAGTLQHARLLEEARGAVRQWVAACRRPVVSVSGGKDSVLLLSICREIAPGIEAIRADPPNPLPDREQHVADVVTWSGGRWHVVDYPWDVEAVLAGDVPYPHDRKVTVLSAYQRVAGFDGVATGIRASESRQRAISVARHGLVLRRADGVWSCRPLARWSALDVLAEVERRDLPLNPVYRHTAGIARLDYERLRDGTWWPHTGGHEVQVEEWINRYYPSVYPSFVRAVALGQHGQRRSV